MTPPDAIPALPADSTDGQARAAACNTPHGHGATPEPIAFVTYNAGNRVLVKGPLETATAAARRIDGSLDVRVLATDPDSDRLERPDIEDFGPRLLRARPEGVDGYLGAFRISIHDGEQSLDLCKGFGLDPAETFDLVVDLDRPAAIRRQKLPLGYFAPGDETALAEVLDGLPDLVGDFDKPRYFDYDPNLCVHGSRGQSGCTNCLDSCATEAIHSLGERIEVDPFLCLGCGSCATACPTGAITYTAPSGEQIVDELRRLLRRYREAGGSNPVVLFHDAEAGASALAAWRTDLPESVLPVEVEDTGGIGPDAWLAALAFGAGRVVLAMPGDTPPSERAATADQMEVAQAVLAGLAIPAERLGIVDIGGDESALTGDAAPVIGEPATFAGLGDKRARMRRAIEHLYRQTGATATVQALPAASPLGTIEVDQDACTLCMACVSVCPTQAVLGGGDEPKLKFREDRCVQCGMCETTCPEDAIVLQPRIDFAAQVEPEERVLNEEEMHQCPGCGKAFAPVKVIQRMEERLAQHWMFADEAARRRLWLCEDCRVKAMMRDQGSINVNN
ncbi:4Fe-4S binding protein [Halofilum ochraceum]|uniref:4Fe-4S binding protein n=1 Tax=Halofilum ochraceum TaxID=1611323 RepID=UPI0008D983B4|nr:4Fe-4S binding protein [Halofilum ochraceum]